MNFYKYFSARILERGMDYYHNDFVKDVNINENTLSALVEGTEPYKVSIILDSDKIIEMKCTCPYAESGKKCKHMVAALFKWESEYRTPNYSTPSIYSLRRIQKENAESILSASTEEQQKGFLLELLENNQKLLTDYKLRTNQVLTDADFAGYKARVDHILRVYTVKYGWIDYKVVGEFFEDFYKLLNEDVELLIENNYLKMAFDLTMYMFIEISLIEPEDSNGDLGYFCDECVSVWKRILEEADCDLDEYIMECLQTHVDMHDNFYIHEYITKITSIKDEIKKEHSSLSDPFYRKENIAELERRVDAINSGKSVLKEHDLIEEE